MRTYFSVPVFVNAFFCAVEMERVILTEQRTNFKFLVKFGKSGREILEMLETVYDESAMKRRTVYKWVDRFKKGRESVDDNAREGRLSASRVGENIQRVHDLVMSDRHRIITDNLAISKGRVRRVRPDLWAEKNWILHHDHHDNASSHLVLIVREFFAKNDMITTDHPSYSPNLAPCDFFFVP
jgi:hypothetical protein